MGFRFRRSVRLTKGIRLNIGKRSLGFSFGAPDTKASVGTEDRTARRVGTSETDPSYVNSFSAKAKTQPEKADQHSDTPETGMSEEGPSIRCFPKESADGLFCAAIFLSVSWLVRHAFAGGDGVSGTATAIIWISLAILSAVVSLSSLLPLLSAPGEKTPSTQLAIIGSVLLLIPPAWWGIDAMIKLIPDQEPPPQITASDPSSGAFAGQAVDEGASLPSSTEVMVYVSGSGTKYHSVADCSGMQSPQEMPVAEAVSEGYTACSVCDPPVQ